MMPKRMRWWMILGFVFLLFVDGPATAQDGGDEFSPGEAGQPNEAGIAVSARLGFDGFHKRRSWMPVTILVSNDGPAVEGTIVIRGTSGQSRYMAPISLPTQSRKRIRLNFFGSGRESSFGIQIINEEGQTVASVASNVVRPLPATNSLIYGVVSSQPEALEFLEKVTAGRAEVGVAFLKIEELPENPALWRDLDVLVFNDVDTNELTAGQRTALEAWLGLGGQLVVTGGVSWQKTIGAFDSLLPVEVIGSRAVDDLPAFAQQTNEPFRDPGPYILAESRLREGTALFFEGGEPILARRPVGRGAAYFLALDPQFAPLDDWDGSEILWTEIGRRTPRPAFWESGFVVDGDAANAVSVLPSLTLPSVFLLVGFVLLYILIIGPINFMFLRSSNRRELAWLTIPGIILFFSLTAYLIGLGFKGNTVLVNQMAIVTGRVGEPTGLVDAGLGIYSPRRGSYNIVLEEDVLMRRLDSFSFNEEDLRVLHGTDVRLLDTLIDVGEVGTFAARTSRPLPDIDAVVTVDPNNPAGFLLQVTNSGGFTLEEVGLWAGGTYIDLGDLDPGDTLTHTWPSSLVDRDDLAAAREGLYTYQTLQVVDPSTSGSYQASPFESYYYGLLGTSSYYGDSVYYPRYELLESIFDHYGQDPVFDPQRSVTLIGWSNQDQLDIRLENGRYENSGVTLYFLEIPFDSR